MGSHSGNLDLTSIGDLLEAVWMADPALAGDEERVVGQFRGTYCSVCGDYRRMRLEAKFNGGAFTREKVARRWTPDVAGDPKFARLLNTPWTLSLGLRPGLFVAVCLECETTMTLVATVVRGDPTVITLPSGRAGVATSHTPAAVSHFLNQAHLSQMGGAAVAALVMYRAALEQVLKDQEVPGRMLADKIAALGSGEDVPDWSRLIEPEHLTVLRRLGNRAVHDGPPPEVNGQDDSLLRDVQTVFIDLLEVIYEEPHKREQRISRLRDTEGATTDEAKVEGATDRGATLAERLVVAAEGPQVGFDGGARGSS